MMSTFGVKFDDTGQAFCAKFSKSTSQRFTSKFSEGAVVTVREETDYYDGDYQITPSVEAQTLPTAKKTMLNNLVVKAIPTFDVSNTAGGTTFYIATMDE